MPSTVLISAPGLQAQPAPEQSGIDQLLGGPDEAYLLMDDGAGRRQEPGRRRRVLTTVAAGAATALVLGGGLGYVLYNNGSDTDHATVSSAAAVSPSGEAATSAPDLSAQAAASASSSGDSSATDSATSTGSSATSSGADGSVNPSTVATASAPPAPQLNVYLPSASAALVGADGRASLRATGVRAGSGQVASVVVKYSGGSQAMARRGVGDYSTVVRGLTNGHAYSFTVTVCNTHRLCTDSAPLSYTPYGMPTAGEVSIAATGQNVTVTWTAAATNGSPVSLTCSMMIDSSPDDADAPSDLSIGLTAGTHSFTGKPGTDYRATKRCSSGRLSTSASSTTVHLEGTSTSSTN